MKERTYKARIEFIEPLLGSQPSGQVASEFIARRAGFEGLPEDEIETLPDALEKGTTVFHKDPAGNPCLFNYQVKGFLKNSGKVQNGQVDGGTKNLRSKVNDLIFITPRLIRIQIPAGERIEFLERPLRAETAQGPRVALARSEMIPSGAWIEFGLTVLGEAISEQALRDLLDYGYFQGLGQWRNGGWGKFRYTLTPED